MKKLFLIESEFFLRQAIEKTLKEKGWQVYSSEGKEDCLYLVKDLSPDLLLLGLDSLSNQPEQFFSFLEAEVTQIPVVRMGVEGQRELMKEVGDFLELPLSPTRLEEQLLSFLEKRKKE